MKLYPVTISLLLGGTFLSVAQEKPHIIIIYTDDMGYVDLSCYGGDFVKTENIDRLNEEKIRFTQYYTAAPISSPSRGGITTGMYLTLWGIRSFLQTKERNRKNIQNDFLSDCAPFICNYDFDEYTSTWESPDPDEMITASNWIWSDQDSIKRWNRTAYYVDKTHEFLKKNRDKPCYINLWPDDVHTPFVPNPQQLSTDKNDWEKVESFRFVLKEYDKQIGRLMQGLKSLGIIPGNTVLTERNEDAAAWYTIPKRLIPELARCMEIYAAQIIIMDQGIGRIIEELERTHQLENTVIMFLYDNVACADMISHDDKTGEIGGIDASFESYGLVWTNASNPPFQMFKHWT